MTVKEAKNIAERWVHGSAEGISPFYAAFYHGSVNWLADEAVFPPNSDLDIVLISSSQTQLPKGKFLYENLLLEVTYMPPDQFRSAEQLLGNYHLAGNFSRTQLIFDVTGKLLTLQKEVAQKYANRQWVKIRCIDALENASKFLNALNRADPVHDQVTSWLFARGVLCHILLVAGLKNPTVRKRYAAVRELLNACNKMDFYESLLQTAGFFQVTKPMAESCLFSLTEVYDEACIYLKTPYLFATDISVSSRKLAINGCSELIAAGLHREAMFWIVAAYCRCQHVLFTDAPREIQLHYKKPFLKMLDTLHIPSYEDRKRDNERLRQFLPEIMEMAEYIIDIVTSGAGS